MGTYGVDIRSWFKVPIPITDSAVDSLDI